MKKTILFLVNHDVVIYNFRKELVEKLLLEDYEVIISSPYGERIDELVKMGCKFDKVEIQRHGTNPIADLSLLRYYKRIMKEYNPSVILTYTIKPNIYGAMAAKKLNIPCIANITGLGSAVENGGIIQKVTLFLYKIAFSDIHKVFFQNIENQNFFKKNDIGTGKYDLLPGSGVNINYFHYLNYPNDDKIKFVFISRIMKEKGIDQYIEVAKYFTKKYSNVEFHICGFCEERYEVKLSQLENNGIVIYHGMIKDTREVLKDMHCTIHPTYYPEGMSNVLLESASSGRPIITTNRSGCKETVDDGITGYIVEEKNVNDLKDKIEKFLALDFNAKMKMGQDGRKKIISEFNRDIVVDRYYKEISNLMDQVKFVRQGARK